MLTGSGYLLCELIMPSSHPSTFCTFGASLGARVKATASAGLQHHAAFADVSDCPEECAYISV